MIELVMSPSGKPCISQRAFQPLVYLDHFAVMEIAKHSRDRFAEALKGARGTWGISWVNFLEFTGPDESEAVLAEELIAACRPNFVFTEAEAGKVIEKENSQIGKNPPELNPCIAQEFANLYVEFGNAVDPLTPNGFVRIWRSSPKLRASLLKTAAEATETLATEFGSARRRQKNEREVRRNLDMKIRKKFHLPKEGTLQVPPTRFVMFAVIAHMVKNEMNLSDGHHLRDFWHTVVPISYADFVLLDGGWKTIAQGVQARLRDEDLLSGDAAVLSGYPGIECLISSLEMMAI